MTEQTRQAAQEPAVTEGAKTVGEENDAKNQNESPSITIPSDDFSNSDHGQRHESFATPPTYPALIEQCVTTENVQVPQTTALSLLPATPALVPIALQQPHNLHQYCPPQNLTHNLIPGQLGLQAPSMAPLAVYQPALIHPGGGSVLPPCAGYSSPLLSVVPPAPVLTVQDRPMIPPVFNGVNPHYPGLRVLHSNPPIYAVDNFLSAAECNFLIGAAQDSFGPAPVVGKGSGEVSASRTSSTCYLAREDLPDYMTKVTMLTGKPVEHCELPQVGRYLPSQQYLQHFDAFDLSNEDGRRFAANGGQRTVTVLVYLNDVPRGGQTAFPSLNLEVHPRQGMAIVFFPASVDGLLDKMALHAAKPAVDTKYVSQVWIRQGNYDGQPSKRLARPLQNIEGQLLQWHGFAPAS